nr:MAG TPA: hypothetical protein [Caudoviricetes sp.]
MVGTAISVVTTVSGPTVILSTLLAHRVVYNVVRLVLRSITYQIMVLKNS